MVMLPTCWLKGLEACCRPGAVPPIVTRILNGQAGKDVLVHSQPLLPVNTVLARRIHLWGGLLLLPSSCKHGNKWRVLGGNLKGQPVHRKWISNVGSPVLNRALAGDGSLHVVAKHGEHRQTAVLISFTFSSAPVSGSSAKPRGSNHLPPGYTRSRSHPPNGPPFTR